MPDNSHFQGYVGLTERSILEQAIDTYGQESQMKMVLEEMSELQKEICKRWRGAINTHNIAEEIADVEIMLEQLKMMLDIERDVRFHRAKKVMRLKERLYGEEGQ